jgi:TP901 family phage tail tape measure protein
MASQINTNINVTVNSAQANAQLKSLAAQISAFNSALSKSNTTQAAASKSFAKDLMNAVNSSKLFTAETVRLNSAAGALDKTLSRGRATMGQFFDARFKKNSFAFAEAMQLAEQRVKRLGTQYIATSGASRGFQDAIAVRPLTAFNNAAALAANRSQVLSNMLRQGTTQMINFGKNTQWAGRQLMVGFTVPMTIFGTTAGKIFMDLEKEMVYFKRVYGDVFTTTEETQKNLDSVMSLAEGFTKYGVAVKDTVALAGQVAAAGRKDVELRDAVNAATRLGVLGQMDQNEALSATIALQSAFRISGQELAQSIDFLNAVENQTVVSLQDISAAIPRVAPVIQGLGGDVKDLTVFLAAMQEGGVSAEQGANALKSGLASLINPTKAATEMLRGFNVDLDYIINTNRGDLMGTVMAFGEALQGLDDFSRQQALEKVFGKYQYARLGALFENIGRSGSQASQVLELTGRSVEELSALSQKELQAIEQSSGTKFKAAFEQLKMALVPIGEIFVKTATPILEFFTKIAEKFNNLPDFAKKFLTFGTILAGVVVPAATMFLGLFFNLIGTLTKFGQSIGLVMKGMWQGGLYTAITKVSEALNYMSLEELDAVQASRQLTGSTNALNAEFLEQTLMAGNAKRSIDQLAISYGQLIAAQRGLATMMPGFGMAAGASARVGGIKSTLPKGPKGFADGGVVPGSGNKDTYPALLTPGEVVVNKEAAAKNRPFLDAINQGKLPKFAGGSPSATSPFLVNALAAIFKATGRTSPSQMAKVVQKTKSPIGKPTSTPKTSLKSPQENTFVHAMGNIKMKSASFLKANIPSEMKALLSLTNSKQIKQLRESIAQQTGKAVKQDRILGSIGFDISKNINSRLNRPGKNPVTVREFQDNLMRNKQTAYNTMLSRLGITDPAQRQAMIQKIEKEVIRSLRRHSRGNPSKTITDADIYTFLPRAVRKATGGRKYRKLTQPSEIRVSISQRELSEMKNSGLIKDFVRGKGQNFNIVFNDGKSLSINTRGTKITKGKDGSYTGTSKFVGMNDGGVVPGTGNKDTVPAMLTPGEVVVKKSAAMKFGGVLKAMNSGGIVNYAEASPAITPATQIGSVSKIKSPGLSSPASVPTAPISAAADNIADDSKKLSNRMNAMSGKVAMASGAIGGLAFAASMASGGTNEMANKVAMGGMAVSGLASLLPMLNNPYAAAIAGFVAVTGSLYMVHRSNEAQYKKGVKLQEQLSSTQKSLQSFGSYFGTKTNAQKLAEKAAGVENYTRFASTGAQFLQEEQGKQFLTGVQNVISQKGNAIAAEQLGFKLAQSVASGIMTEDQAQSIAYAVGESLKNQKFGIEVAGTISSLVGADGKDLLTNPLSVAVALNANADQIAQMALLAFEAANKNTPSIFGAEFFSGQADEAKRQAGSYATAVGVSLQSQKENIANVTIEYDKMIANAKDAGEIERLEQRKTLALEELNLNYLKTKNDVYDSFIQKGRDLSNSTEEVVSTTQKALSAEKNLFGFYGGEGINPVNLGDANYGGFSGEQQDLYSGLGESLKSQFEGNKDLQAFVNATSKRGTVADFKLRLSVQEGVVTPQAANAMAILRNSGPDGRIAYETLLTLKADAIGPEGVQQMITAYASAPDEETKKIIQDFIIQTDPTKIKQIAPILAKLEMYPDVYEKMIKITLEDNISEEEVKKIDDAVTNITRMPDTIAKKIILDYMDTKEELLLVDELITKYKNLSPEELKKEAELFFQGDEEKLAEFIKQWPLIKDDPEKIAKFAIELAVRTPTLKELQTLLNSTVDPKERKRLQALIEDTQDIDTEGKELNVVKTPKEGDGEKANISLIQQLQAIIKLRMRGLDAEKLSSMSAEEQVAAANGQTKALKELNRELRFSAIITDALKTPQQKLADLMSKTNDVLSAQINFIEQVRISPLKKELDKLSNLNVKNQKDISLRTKGLSNIQKAEETINVAYEKRIEALDKVSQQNERIARASQQQISLAGALTSGDIAAAAQIASEMSSDAAQNRIEDTAAALEISQQSEIDALTTSINGKLMTRKQIEAEIETIEEKIYQNNLKSEEVQENIKKIEEEKLALMEKQRKIQALGAIAELSRQLRTTPDASQQELIQEQISLTGQSIGVNVTDQASVDTLAKDIGINLSGYSKMITTAQQEALLLQQESSTQYQTAFNSIKNKLSTAVADAGNSVTFINAVKNAWGNPKDGLLVNAKQARSSVEDVGIEFNLAAETVKTAVNTMKTNLSKIVYPKGVRVVGGQLQFYAMGGLVKYAMGGKVSYKGSRESAPGMNMGGPVKKYANGNIVPGFGSTDSVPALLTPGEFVVRKSATKANLPLLRAINDQVFPSMSNNNLKTDGTFAANMTSSVTNMPMYNNYSINVNVPNTDASPEDIANTVMSRIRRYSAGEIRGTRR